jgi:large subunit ribosomal protein L6
MSRVANAPVALPKGVEVKREGPLLSVKGPRGELSHQVHEAVDVTASQEGISFAGREGVGQAVALAGTTRALVQNMVVGVSEGFERKLELVGVGYRAQMKGNVLSLALGYSHPVEFPVPEGITIETPSQTEVLVKGIDKQRVGQAAAVIRGFRPPEPYKGKGVKYANEQIIRKEAKKK